MDCQSHTTFCTVIHVVLISPVFRGKQNYCSGFCNVASAVIRRIFGTESALQCKPCAVVIVDSLVLHA